MAAPTFCVELLALSRALVYGSFVCLGPASMQQPMPMPVLCLCLCLCLCFVTCRRAHESRQEASKTDMKARMVGCKWAVA